MVAGAKYWPAGRTEYGRYATPDSRPPLFKLLLSPFPNRWLDRSRLFGNALGWMNRAGSVGFQVPSMCCHWRVRLASIWKFFAMFFARIASTSVTTTWLQV